MLSRPLFADQLESPRTGQFSSGSDRQTKQGQLPCLRRIYRLRRWFTTGQGELVAHSTPLALSAHQVQINDGADVAQLC